MKIGPKGLYWGGEFISRAIFVPFFSPARMPACPALRAIVSSSWITQFKLRVDSKCAQQTVNRVSPSAWVYPSSSSFCPRNGCQGRVNSPLPYIATDPVTVEAALPSKPLLSFLIGHLILGLTRLEIDRERVVRVTAYSQLRWSTYQTTIAPLQRGVLTRLRAPSVAWPARFHGLHSIQSHQEKRPRISRSFRVTRSNILG
jgi:hypothetical protein